MTRFFELPFKFIFLDSTSISPLLLRIILSSTQPYDTVLDPLAGTGPTLVVAKQLKRNSIGIEIDPKYTEVIRNRLKFLRQADNVSKYYNYYRFTPNLKEIWPAKGIVLAEQTKMFKSKL